MDYQNPHCAGLLDALLTRNDLQLVADKAALVLKNPVGLFDSSYYVMVYSSVHEDADDPVWVAGLRRGFCTYEYISLIHSVVPDRSKENRSTYAPASGVSALRRMLGRLVVNETVMGYFAVLEHATPLEEIPNETYDFVAGILAKAVSTERSMLYFRKSLDYENIMIDLLGSGVPNRKLFRERIRGSEFDRPATYQLFCIDMTKYPSGNMLEPSLRATMQRILPSSWSVYDRQYIVILVDLSHEFYRSAEALGEWTTYLRDNRMRAGQSCSFEDLYLLSNYYRQAVRVLELSVQYQDLRVIVPYEEYKLVQAVADLPRDHLLDNYCSSAVNAIRGYDQLHNTEYLLTLYHYLHTGRSFKATAAALHLHRNTIIYRIGRIRELFGMDFSDEPENFRHYFSCMLLRFHENAV